MDCGRLRLKLGRFNRDRSYNEKTYKLTKVWGKQKNTQLTSKNLWRETVKTGYKYTRECTYNAGLQVSGEELNTYEN